jgi:hypothetical protein
MISFIFPIYDYSTLVNSIGIILEIIGFFLTFRVVRRIVKGGFTKTGFTKTGFTMDHTETKVVPNPNTRLLIIGIVLVTAGLIGQLVAQGIRGGW